MDNQELLSVVYEAYIGKTPTLLEAEEQIGIIRSKFNLYNINNSDPAVLKFNRLIEKQFGMDLFGLKIAPTEELDANTLEIGLRFDLIDKDMKKYVVGDMNKGYRFIKDNGLCIIVEISWGFLGNKHYSDSDCVAIILHEIGHNFADCMLDRVIFDNKAEMTRVRDSVIANAVYDSVIDYTLKNNFNTENDMRQEKKIQSKKRSSSRVAAFFAGLKNKLGYKATTISDVINLMNGRYAKDWEDPTTDEEREDNRTCVNREKEVISDKFATIYGYGSNLANALLKMDNIRYDRVYKLATKYGGKRGRQNAFYYRKAIMSLHDTEEHPHEIQRVNSMINTLENEYKKSDIDPKIKAELLKQINTLKRQLKYETESFNKYRNIDKAQANMYAYINKSCPDATTKEIEDNIEKVLDERLKELEKN